MKGLVDSLHTMGFKVGIYSGPWVATYAAHIGTQCDNADGTYEWVKKGLVNENYRMVDPSGELTREKLWYSGKYSIRRPGRAPVGRMGLRLSQIRLEPARLVQHERDAR